MILMKTFSLGFSLCILLFNDLIVGCICCFYYVIFLVEQETEGKECSRIIFIDAIFLADLSI